MRRNRSKIASTAVAALLTAMGTVDVGPAWAADSSVPGDFATI